MSLKSNVSEWNDILSPLSLEDRIARISKEFSNSVFTTSLGAEDQVLTWSIATFGRGIRIVTLQTGRLFPEVVSLLSDTNEKYGISIEDFEPDPSDVDRYVSEFGINGFYESIEARKACCEIRKLVPLRRALKNMDVWITGLRREQSDNRQQVPFAEWDDGLNLMKINPLAHWTSSQIADAIAQHKIPVNPMHERGYPSIGCEPCTRVVKPGEPDRAGRWWWEQDQSRECGLHVSHD